MKNKSLILYFILIMLFVYNLYSEDISVRLHEAVISDDLESVKSLIIEGANVKEPYGSLKLTPLHCLSIGLKGIPLDQKRRTNNTAITLLLIKNGGDINAQSQNGSTPLFLASYYDNIKTALPLIQNGAKTNLKTKDIGMTPLHAAALRGNYEIAKLLLNNGAKVNAQDNGGNTPMHRAAAMEIYFNQDLSILLLGNGADISIKNKKGNTVLDIAKNMQNKKMLEFLTNYKGDK